MNENIRTNKYAGSEQGRVNPYYKESPREHSYGYKSAERDDRILKRKKERIQKKKIAFGVLCLLFLVIMGSLYTVFRFRATVTINLSTYQKGSDMEYTAYREPTGTMVPFYLTTETIDLNKSLTATGTKQVSKKAEGVVTFYNKLNVKQKFKAKTRLSDVEGNLYFTENKEFILPAGTDDSPSSIDVKVESSKPGYEYNKKEGDKLTIIGWKGTLKFEKQFAMVKNLGGGEVGVVPDIDENELLKEKNSARNNLLAALTERAHANQDDSLIVYPVPESLVVDVLETYTSPTNEQEMILKESGSITILKIKKDDLASHIASAYELLLKPNEVDMKFIIVNEKEISLLPTVELPADLFSMPSFTFRINGDPQIGYAFNRQKFLDQIKGKTIDETSKFIKKIFDFQNNDVVVRPFWMGYLPNITEYIELLLP